MTEQKKQGLECLKPLVPQTFLMEEGTMRDYTVIPLCINEYSDLDTFDEYEAKEAGWPLEIIRAAIGEIYRREMSPNIIGEV